MSYQEKYLKYKNKYLALKSNYLLNISSEKLPTSNINNYKNLVELNESENSLINLTPKIINLNNQIIDNSASLFKQDGGNKKNKKKIKKQFAKNNDESDSDLSVSDTLSQSDSDFSSSEIDW